MPPKLTARVFLTTARTFTKPLLIYPFFKAIDGPYLIARLIRAFQMTQEISGGVSAQPAKTLLLTGKIWGYFDAILFRMLTNHYLRSDRLIGGSG